MARTKRRVPPVIMKILKAVENMSAAEASEALQNAAEDEESVENRVLLLQARVKLLQEAIKPKRPPRKRKRKPKPPKVEKVAETPPEPEPEEPTGTVTAIDLDNLGALFGAVERGASDAPASKPPAPKKPAKPGPAASGDIDFDGLDDLMDDDDDAPAKAGGAIEMPDLSALGDLDGDGAEEDDEDDDGADLSALMASMNLAGASAKPPVKDDKDDAAPDLSALQDPNDAPSDDDDDDDLTALMGAFSGGASRAAGATGPDTPGDKTAQTTATTTPPKAETKAKASHSPAIPNLSALKDLNGSAEDETDDDDLTALMGAFVDPGPEEANETDTPGILDLEALSTPEGDTFDLSDTMPETAAGAAGPAAANVSQTDDLSALMAEMDEKATEEPANPDTAGVEQAEDENDLSVLMAAFNDGGDVEQTDVMEIEASAPETPTPPSPATEDSAGTDADAPEAQALSEPDQADAPGEQDAIADPHQPEEDQAELPPEPVSSGDQPDDTETPDYSEFEALMGSVAQGPVPDSAETDTDTVSEQPDAEDDADFSEFNALMAAAQTDIPAEEADGGEQPATDDLPLSQEVEAAPVETVDDGEDNAVPMDEHAESAGNDADNAPVADLSALDALENIQGETAEETDPEDPQPDAEPKAELQETPDPDLSAQVETPAPEEVVEETAPEALNDTPATSYTATAKTDPAATGETKAAQPEPVQPEAPAPRQEPPAASFAEGKKKATLDDIYSLFPKKDG